MDDLRILRDAWGAPEAPSPSARAQARAAMMAGRRRAVRSGRSWRVRIVAAAGTAAALATGMFVLANLGGEGGRERSVVPGLPNVPAATAAVLERAAEEAERKPFTPPRDDQWIYIRERIAEGGPGGREMWRRADGGGTAFTDERGKLVVEETGRRDPKRARATIDSYRAVAALPPEPEALLRWAYRQARHTTGAGLTEDGDVYAILKGLLGGNVLPPELEAAIFRALKRVPGVTVETVDVLGSSVLSLGLTEDWLRQELLLDPETYAYWGQRSTIVRDARIDPEKAGNATGEVKKGSRVISVREATAIVDEPGRRR
jgi:hypothetical protein